MRVVVTGASGFVGSHVALALKARGHAVCLLGRPSSRFSDSLAQFECLTITWSDHAALTEALARADAVVHAAGATAGARFDHFHDGNVVPTQQLLMAAQAANANLRSFVFISSQAAAGPSPNDQGIDERAPARPITWYGRSKRAAEVLVEQAQGIGRRVILRPSSVYGPGDRAFLPFFRAGLKGWSVEVGGGPRWMQMIHVADLAEATVRAAESGTVDGIYFVAGPGQYRWSDLVATLQICINRRIRTIQVPYHLATLVAYFNDLLGQIRGKPVIVGRDKLREYRPTTWLAHTERLHEALGWEPRTSLEHGFRETLEWVKKGQS